MKIKPEHYQYLSDQVSRAITHMPGLDEYQAAGMSAKRWRWDALWAAKISSWIQENIYPYANDDHIDTALRRITGTS